MACRVVAFSALCVCVCVKFIHVCVSILLLRISVKLLGCHTVINIAKKSVLLVIANTYIPYFPHVELRATIVFVH